MSLQVFDGLVWFVACLVPFLWVQRWLQRQIQAVFLLITRHPAVSLGLFSLLFFPGVLLHEGSHFIVAKLLGVRTGHFSLLPQLLPDGRLRLGYVETAISDPVRDSLIGAAPLAVGAAALTYLSLNHFGLSALAESGVLFDWRIILEAVQSLPARQDFWLWFYFAFTISSTMLPSASDRRAWLPIALGMAVLLGVMIVAGAGPWMLAKTVPWLNLAFRGLALILTFSLLIHLCLVIPVGIFKVVLSRITGLQVR